MNDEMNQQAKIIGFREWVSLPLLKLPSLSRTLGFLKATT
jgi:hypothetical protein